MRAGRSRLHYTLRSGLAWTALCLALALHVTDEALTDFLSVYNPAVQRIRERLPYLPLPVFDFDVWLTSLCAAVIILLAMSWQVFRGAPWTRPLSYVFGGLMLMNAMGHVLGSFYLGRVMPGAYSSPFLFACSIWLLFETAHQPESRNHVVDAGRH
ncbi:MAG: HXXEE domain-containing protein [Acidobacteria bacterium]|nr:HXXEE domain-containing protein [Acidobacteriota bacterium]